MLVLRQVMQMVYLIILCCARAIFLFFPGHQLAQVQLFSLVPSRRQSFRKAPTLTAVFCSWCLEVRQTSWVCSPERYQASRWLGVQTALHGGLCGETPLEAHRLNVSVSVAVPENPRSTRRAGDLLHSSSAQSTQISLCTAACREVMRRVWKETILTLHGKIFLSLKAC